MTLCFLKSQIIFTIVLVSPDNVNYLYLSNAQNNKLWITSFGVVALSEFDNIFTILRLILHVNL